MSKSTGLTFMQATAAAIPKTMGDRDRISLLSSALALAIKGRFAFDKLDATALYQLRHVTSVGIFNPLNPNWYRQACIEGGTFPRMWETDQGLIPWIGQQVLSERYPLLTLIGRNRITEGMGVLLAMPVADDPDPELERAGDNQVWWCTSITNTHLTLCRYPQKPSYPNHPKRVRKVSREEWAILNPKPEAEAMPLAA